MGWNFPQSLTMEYNKDVEEFQDIEYPMLQGKILGLSIKSSANLG
jgi:hypothetical protein